jgi:hypothetical protein
LEGEGKMRRDSKFLMVSIGVLILGLHEFVVGWWLFFLSSPHTAGYRIGVVILFCAILDLFIGICFASYDHELNRDFDADKADRKKFEEYKRLQGRFEGRK